MPSRPSLRDQPKKLKDQDSVQDMEALTAECVRERSYKQLKPGTTPPIDSHNSVELFPFRKNLRPLALGSANLPAREQLENGAPLQLQ
jgi:hypothetical protein